MSEFGFVQFRQDYISAGGSATSEAKNSLRIGFYIAAEMDFNIQENSFIKTGLKFSTMGDSYFFKTDDVVFQQGSSETDEKYKLRPRVDFLSIPINYGINVTDRLSLFVGVSPSIQVNNILRANRFEQKGTSDEVKIKWDKVDNPVAVRGLVNFLNIGSNFYWGTGSKMKYIFDFRFNYSLNSIYDDDLVVDKINNAKMWNVEVGFGIAI